MVSLFIVRWAKIFGKMGQTSCGGFQVPSIRSSRREECEQDLWRCCALAAHLWTLMNPWAHFRGKLLHYTKAQQSLISLGGQHPGGSPDRRIYSGPKVPISLVAQSVHSPTFNCLSVCLLSINICFIIQYWNDAFNLCYLIINNTKCGVFINCAVHMHCIS